MRQAFRDVELDRLHEERDHLKIRINPRHSNAYKYNP